MRRGPAVRGWALFLLLLASEIQAEFRPDGVDPYEVLGLARGGDLSPQALKRAYRQAALRWHPDKVPEAERKEAEQKFITIAWAYEVLGDPARRGAYDTPPGAGAAFDQGDGTGGGGPGTSQRGFSMKSAAKVFRDVFGNESQEYAELVEHLMRSSTGGDKEQWRKHAEAIRKALKRGRGANGDFDVETKAPDGTGRIRTSQRSTSDGKGTTTKTTRTEHTHTSVNGAAPKALGGAAGHLPDLEAQHRAAHEAAVRAAEEAHRAALASAGLLPHHMGSALPGKLTEL